MENERTPCDGASKTTKKTKAAGAFRVFLNFLQKPAKKKHENESSLKGETNVGAHFDLVVPRELESGEREFAVKGKVGNLDNSKSWSFSGGVPDVVADEEATLSSIPEGRDLLPLEDSPMVRGSDVDVVDDEVFLNESYFEDDYFEDFSSSSSSGSNSNFSSSGAGCHGGANDKDNVAPHCDEDDFIKFIDSFPYLNNLDTANEVDKGYNKSFPDFICRDQDLNQNIIWSLTDRPRHRQRHCSMPCSLVGDSSRSRSDGRSSSDKSLTDGEEEKLLTLPLAAVAADIARSLQAPTTTMTFPVKSRSDIILPNENDNDPYGDGAAGTSGTSENVNNVRISTPDRLGLLLLDKITTPFDHKSIENNDNGLQMKIDAHSELLLARLTGDANRASIHSDTIRLDKINIPANPAAYSCSTLQPKSIYERGAIINTTQNVVSRPASAAAATTCEPTEAALTSKEQKEAINNCNRRHSCLSSVESGYGSVCKSSSASTTPLSPSTGKATATATPMNKLLVGTPLSPHSLNTLDGVTKPRPTPKRSLKPKFIFPTLTPSELKLKSVPELVELMADIARMQSQIEDDTTGAKDATKVNNEKLMPSQRNKNIADPDTVLKLSDSGIGINLNLSLKAVDVNNNLINPHTNQPQSPIPYCNTNNTSSPLSGNIIVTSPGMSRTPSSRYPMADLNDFTILSPFGKGLRPICTSSPLQSKLAARRRGQRDARSSPMHKLLLESPAIACANNLNDVTYVMSPPKKEKDQNENYIPRTAATSERRKKLKRRSARTRLHFDERDVNNNKKAKECEDVEDDEKNRNHRHPTSGDYVLLKRIAESIIDECSNREMIDSLVDLPGLMENLNGQYSKIMKSHHIDSNTKFSNLKTNIVKMSKRVSTNLTVENCIDIVLMSFLVRDSERMIASLDFVFENLPRVIPLHEFLSELAPEIVILLLTNPRCIVKNNHGFPLSYSSSEKEVFKAIVKYVEAVNRKNKRPVDDRVKNLLSTVADPRVLANKITMNSVERSDLHSHADIESHGSTIVAKRPPRPFHNLVFQRSSGSFASGATRNRDYFFQPFVSSSVQSLDEITGRSNNEVASPTPTSSVCKENYILRKLYFSYRRHSNVPFITKIGMQYSCKGKKKTMFISQSETVGRTSFSQGLNPYNEPVLSHVNYDDIIAGEETAAVMNSDDIGRVPEVDETPSCVVEPAGNESASEVTVVKKAAIVLKAGEHITALSVLGHNVIHNVEIVTNTGRRIRAHGLQDVASDRWIAIATPEGSSPFCLHAIYGDARKSSGRSYIHDLGAIWVSTESAINNLS